jgi:hypothetical protein
MNGKANTARAMRHFGVFSGLSFLVLALGLVFTSKAWADTACPNPDPSTWPEYTAEVVVFDSPMVFNRLGAQNPNFAIYALERDVINLTTGLPGGLVAGNVGLRPDKRPRPMVLRVPRCSKLTINFRNLLAPTANPVMNAGDLDARLEELRAPVAGVGEPRGLECVNNAEGAGAGCPQHAEGGFGPPVIGDNQVKTRFAGVHVQGMQLDAGTGIANDSSYVGNNANSCVAQGDGPTPFTFVAQYEGAFLLSNPCAAIGGEASGGNNGLGMWGVVAVQPMGARIYRSQVYEEEYRLASDLKDGVLDGTYSALTPQGHPIIDYEATYPNQQPWIDEGKANLPILNMITAGREIVHSEINAIVVGPDVDGTWTTVCPGADCPYPLEDAGIRNPAYPTRLEPFRDFMSGFHDETAATDAFEGFFKHPVLGHTLHGVRDSFMINYASGGIGSEIIANRLGVGPMYDCMDCAYEEFFLTSFTVGDPGMRVDVPANFGLENITPEDIATANLATLGPLVGPKATTALFQDDPANIHNSYTGDFAKVRNVHAGPKEQHIFHQHNHQWLFNANDDRANYLDAQGIGPGSSYTYEYVYGGMGNRNKTAGDAIFHCHFYPHFAQGMWYHMRIHDVTETGTILEASVTSTGHTIAALNGRYHDTPFELGNSPPALASATNAVGLTNIDLTGLPATARNRAHPDGEILAGVPISAVVPLPGKPMAPMPGDVVLVTKDSDGNGVADSSQNYVVERNTNPGYPFWIAGIDCSDGVTGAFDSTCAQAVVGQRPTTPPLDMITQTEASAALSEFPYKCFAGSADPECAQILTVPGFTTAFNNAAGGFDGGLPRHALGGCKDSAAGPGLVPGCPHVPNLIPEIANLFESSETRLDFHKEILKAKGVFFPESGTDLEKVAMVAHAMREHATSKINLDGTVESDGAGAAVQNIVAGGVNQILAGPPTVILAGPNRRANSRAAGDDVQVIPRGTRNLDPNAIVISAGPNGVLDTAPSGDDVVASVAETTAQGDDVQVIPVGSPTPNATDVVVAAGADAVLQTLVPGGNDVLVLTRADTTAAPTDVQEIAVGTTNIAPDAVVVSDGGDGLQTAPAGDDQIVTVGGGGGGAVKFVMNGLPPVPGAPYQDPCVDDIGQPLLASVAPQFFSATGFFNGASAIQGARDWDSPFTYAAANIQIDAVFNKVGYHYPQQRIIALWGDVMPTINKQKAPEPFVMRLNSFNCAKYQHSNLVPKEFEVDDYQVRTPTDIIGQHIHLPKWDLTTADGAANGWNYEDGTLSPGMVVERIEAINAFNGDTALHPEPHPALGAGQGGTGGCATPPFAEWCGSRVTLQRWFADPLVDRDGIDRGLGIVFTHDHYGPSTFQQIGLYSTLLTEPAQSNWVQNETGEPLGARQAGCGDPNLGCDGGPTSWQAAIVPTGWSAAQGEEPFREFYFEFSDFQQAYEAGVYVGAGPDGRPFSATTSGHGANGINNAFPVTAQSFRHAINPSFRQQAICQGPNCPAGGSPFPDIVRFPDVCPGSVAGAIVPRPCPEAINADDAGMLVVNYRNEPIGLRVFDPFALGPDGSPGTQRVDDPVTLLVNEALGGDLAFALATPPLLGPDASTPIAGQPPAASFRAIPQMNVQPAAGATLAVGLGGFYVPNKCPGCTIIPTAFPPPLNDPDALIEGDPYTPMIRAFPGDKVKVKIQAGAHEHEHNASLHGLKWVQGNSGHGAQRASGGWRNSQNIGISEQFNFSMPLNGDPQAKKPFQFDPRRGADYAYAVDSAQDGWWSGMWGLLRSYTGGVPAGANLYPLPGGLTQAPQIANVANFNGVCPVSAPLRQYTVIAIAANEILDKPAAVTVSNGKDGIAELIDAADELHVGGPLDANGGTLVYNPRPTVIAAVNDPEAGPLPLRHGPLHDPTGLMYVLATDLEPDPAAGDQGGACTDSPSRPGVANPACQVRLKPSAPVEPLVLRAAAGECVEATLFNRLTDNVPDLAGFNTLLQMVIRNREAAPGNLAGEVASVTTFNNNLIRPSSYVGLHAQLVEYDATQHDGVVAGGNIAGGAVVGPVEVVAGTPRLAGAPFNAVTYRWYAGHLKAVANGNGIDLLPTAVEFGGSNLSPADKIKQGQKGMVGALVVEPAGATWANSDGAAADDLALLEQVPNRQDNGASIRGTRADMVVSVNGDSFDDLVLMKQSALNHRFRDGEAVPNIASEGQGIPEDSHDAGQKGANYGSEPAWFRFGVQPDANFGNAGAGAGTLGGIDGEQMFSNVRNGDGPDLNGDNDDPWTPVFTATPGQQARMRVLNSTGVGRGSTFDLHGHTWARDPYLPETPGCLTATSGLGSGVPLNAGGGGCGLSSVKIGHNPLAWYLGGQESWTPQGHFDIFLPKAGGLGEVEGDYLYRDHGSFGVTDGIWGITRVVAAAPVDPCAGNQPPVADANGPYSGRRRERIQFSSAGSSDPDGSIVSYLWNFGDGGTNNNPDPRHRYRSTGTFDVTLTVTDNCGATGSDSTTATIN